MNKAELPILKEEDRTTEPEGEPEIVQQVRKILDETVYPGWMV